MEKDSPAPRSPNEDDVRIARAISDQLVRNAIVRILSVARAFAVLPLINPAQLAIYRYVTTSLSYTSYLDCGAANVMGVQYPERIGAGDPDGARKVATSCWRITIAGSLAAAIVSVPLVWIDDLSLELKVALIASASLGLVFKMLTVWYRARVEFREIARIEVMATIASFVGTLGATYLWGLTGLILGTLSLPIIGLAMGRSRLAGLSLGWRWQRTDSDHLFLGIRLWLTGFLFGLASTGDIFILTRLLDLAPADIGPYALASMIAASLDALAAGTGQVLATWLSRIVGETGSVRDPRVLHALESSIARDCFAAVVLIVATSVGLSLFVPLLLDSYLPALPLFACLALGVASRRWLRYPLHMISLVATTKPANILAGCILVFTFGGMLIVARATNNSLFAIAAFVSVTQFLGSAAVLALAYRLLEEPRLGIRVVSRLLLAHAPLLLLPLSSAAIPQVAAPTRLLVGAALALVGCLASFAWLFPSAAREGWGAVIAPFQRLVRMLSPGPRR